MTDDQMDARLREAGDRWRAAADDDSTALTVRPAPPRRSWWLLASAAVIIAVLVAGAVKLSNFGDPARLSGGPPIANVKWYAYSVLPPTPRNGVPADHDQPLGVSAYLRFASDRYTGSDGCNDLGGSSVINSGTIDFGDTFSTEVACTGADVVARILSGRVSYSVTASRLTITKPGGGTLFLGRDPRQRPRTTLPGTWTFTGTQTTSKDGNTGSGSSVSPTDDASRLTFTATGTFTVTDTCPLLRGRYSVSRHRLALPGVTAAAGGCVGRPTGATAQRQRALLVSVLSGTVRWQIEDGQLTLTKGGRGLIFERAR